MHGSIEVNAKQTWDNEQMVFYPLIQEFISVKVRVRWRSLLMTLDLRLVLTKIFVVSQVTELKSVANHVVIGSIFCEPADLFTPLPRTVAVDVNESGTMKLVLEVTWK